MANPPWFKQHANDWLSSTEIMLLDPLEEYALLRLRMHMWRSPTCMLPDNDAILMRLSRLEEYRGLESDITSDEALSKCLANVKQMLSTCLVNGKQMLFDDELLAQWNHLSAVSEVRTQTGRIGGSRKKSGTKVSKAKAKQTISLSSSVSGSDLKGESEGGGLPAACPALPPSLGTALGREALQKWYSYKRSRGQAYKSSHGWAELINTFEPLGDAALMAAVNESIKNSWAGIFPQKHSNGSQRPSRQQTNIQILAAEFQKPEVV